MHNKRVMTVIAMTLIFITMTIPVYANELFEGSFDETRVGDYLGTICTVDSNGNVQLASQISEIISKHSYGGTESVIIKVPGANSVVVTVTKDGYKELKNLARQIYDKESTHYKIQDMADNFNVRADTRKAGQMLSGLQPIVELLCGVAAYLTVLGMGFFNSMDVLYIAIPIFRDRCESMKQSGNRLMTETDRQTGQPKLRWVSDEAQFAVSQASLQNGKNPWGIYLKNRIWAHIMVAIVIYILLTGNISLIVGIALNAVGGIIDVLSGLAK